ncbi:MAG: hypothetical protein PVH18_10300 [Chloroflexota bacterium]|jgi:hypothetical protein
MLETDVDSFIVRFVHVRSAELQNAKEISQHNDPTITPWHGVIRHVQSKEEIRFTEIEDALRFVAKYVALADDDPAPNHND